MDPSIWSAILAAVAALAGVLLGRQTTRSESRIAREDEYRREARTSVAAVITAIRSYQAAFDQLMPGKTPKDAAERFSKCEAACSTLNDRIEDFLLLVQDYPLRRISDRLQSSANRLQGTKHCCYFENYDTESDAKSLRSSLREEHGQFNTLAEEFRDTCGEQLSHVIAHERERGTLQRRARRWLEMRKVLILVYRRQFSSEHSLPSPPWIFWGTLGAVGLSFVILLSLFGLPFVGG